MDEPIRDLDYFEAGYPYHVEMIHSIEYEPTKLVLWYEKGGKSEFDFTDCTVSLDILKQRFEEQEGKIVYVYQDPEGSKDIAVELVNLTGCCSGIRKMLIG